MGLVRCWTEIFSPPIETRAACLQGHRALLALEARLPADCVLLGGIRVPLLVNLGGSGAVAYKASGLRRIRRDLANRLELIVTSADRS